MSIFHIAADDLKNFGGKFKEKGHPKPKYTVLCTISKLWTPFSKVIQADNFKNFGGKFKEKCHPKPKYTVLCTISKLLTPFSKVIHAS